MSETFDDMDLPLASSNEELETTSGNHFRLQFDPKKFEIRPENNKDKGVDFYIEIKKGGKHLNFRFAIQLKATKSIKRNTDGSISLSIRTSNINYLLDAGMPAYYVLFEDSSKTFFYEPLVDFVRELISRDEEWGNQSSHVLRFHKTLDDRAIQEIYDWTYSWGKKQRLLLEKIISQTSITNPDDKLILDANLNVTSDKDIRQMLEGVGLSLINEGRWKDILIMHSKGSSGIASTAKYNLVIGIASYYQGNLSESLSYFRKALSLKSQLTESLQNYLDFMNAIVKYSIGILTAKEYSKEIKRLENDESIGSQIKLEQAKREFLQTQLELNIDLKFDRFKTQVLEILNNPNVNPGTKLNAGCELIFIEGHYNNIIYIQSVANLNAFEMMSIPNFELRKQLITSTNASYDAWKKKITDLQKTAKETKNPFAFFNLSVSQIKVLYEFYVFSAAVYIGQSTNTPGTATVDKHAVIPPLLGNIEYAISYFTQVGHLENTISALALKYEMFHYVDDFDGSGKVLAELEKLIDNYELTEAKRKFNLLKSSGTTHERFNSWLNDILEDKENAQAESQIIQEDIRRMDEEDKKSSDAISKDYLPIHLYPIGYFKFPKASMEKVYEILGITEQVLKDSFNSVFSAGAMPVANIYKDPITEEGYGDGAVVNTSIKSLRTVYSIRKSFFENKFRQFELKLGKGI